MNTGVLTYTAHTEQRRDCKRLESRSSLVEPFTHTYFSDQTMDERSLKHQSSNMVGCFRRYYGSRSWGNSFTYHQQVVADNQQYTIIETFTGIWLMCNCSRTMASQTATAAVSDQIMDERSIIHIKTSQAEHITMLQVRPSTAHTAITRTIAYSGFFWLLTVGFPPTDTYSPWLIMYLPVL